MTSTKHSLVATVVTLPLLMLYLRSRQRRRPTAADRVRMPLDRRAHHDRRQGRRSRPGSTPRSIDQFYLPWLGKNARPAQDRDEGQAALGPRVPLLLRRHGGRRPLRRRQGARRHDLGQRRLRAVLQARRRQAGLLRVPGQRRRHRHGHVHPAPRRRRLSTASTSDGDFHIEAKVDAARHAQQVAATRTRAGRSRAASRGRTSCAPAAGPTPARRGSSPCAATTTRSISKGPELSTCAPLEASRIADFHRYEDYATLQVRRPGRQDRGRPCGIDKRVPLTTSTVVGSPDPPPPYRVGAGVSRSSSSTFPIMRRASMPGTRPAARHRPARSRTARPRICRIKDDPNADEIETLLERSTAAPPTTSPSIPKFAENGYVYVGWNGPRRAAKPKTTRDHALHDGPRSRRTRIDPKSAKIIIEWESDGHNGARHRLRPRRHALRHHRRRHVRLRHQRRRPGHDARCSPRCCASTSIIPTRARRTRCPKDNPFVGQTRRSARRPGPTACATRGG